MSNNKTERNYSSYAGECLAAVWEVSHFRVYLYGRRFVLLTDHEPLKWLMTNEKLTGMHARWAHILSEYDFEIKHRPRKRSGDADGLSRNPLQDETDLTDARMDHEVSPVSPFSVSAGLALLAYQGTGISKVDENQSSLRKTLLWQFQRKMLLFLAQRRTVSSYCNILKTILSLVIFGWIQERFDISGIRPSRKVQVPRNEIVFSTGLRAIIS
jgi:hypothetical protein